MVHLPKVDRHFEHLHGRKKKGLSLLTLCGIPYLHIAVAASGYKLRALGVVVDAKYEARVSFEDSARQTLFPRIV